MGCKMSYGSHRISLQSRHREFIPLIPALTPVEFYSYAGSLPYAVMLYTLRN
jgi:hypothetical protein